LLRQMLDSRIEVGGKPLHRGGRGVAWLTEGTVAAYGRKRLTPIGGDKWHSGVECTMANGR